MIGQVVRRALDRRVTFRTLPLAEYQAVSELFAADLFEWLDFERAVEQANFNWWNCSRLSVEAQLVEAKRLLVARPREICENLEGKCIHRSSGLDCEFCLHRDVR